MKARKSSNRTGKKQAGPPAELPDAVLPLILQHIPLWQRLTTCTLACKAWNTAVASTTADVDHQLWDPPQCQQLQAWLQHWAGQVVSMQLSAGDDVQYERLAIELPCCKLSQLERLSVSDLLLQLHTGQARVSTRSSRSRTRSLSYPAAATGTAGPASGTGFLPKLQQLKLVACSMTVQHFLQLSKLTALDSLALEGISLLTRANRHVNCVNDALRAVLQQLTGLSSLTLTDLAVQDVDNTASALAPISNMQHLQRLSLDHRVCPDVTPLLPVLPTSLMELELDGEKDMDMSRDAEHEQVLCRLCSLQELVLMGVWMDPQVLCACSPQLKRLVVHNCELAGQPVPHNNEAVSTLLSALARLTQLQSLELINVDLHKHPQLQQFSALTASSQLTSLRLADSDFALLPKGALQHMLPAGRQLPQLRVLNLAACNGVRGCLAAADLARIGSCCCELQELHLEYVVCNCSDFSGLLPLQSNLTNLGLAGAAFGDAAAEVVAQLTNLRTLTWDSADVLTDAGVRQLTALQQLTELYFLDCHSVALFDDLDNPDNPAIAQKIDRWGWYTRPGSLSLWTLEDKAQRPDVARHLAHLLAAVDATSRLRRKTRTGTNRSG